jgi:hypothetical protein
MAMEHWQFRQNVHKKKDLLKSLAALLTAEIQTRSSAKATDFRFLLPLSQWLVEQAGYTITPQGNNPGNVMGSGDAGTFNRPNNTEIVGGKRVNVPADFANFSTMEAGTTATFDRLKMNWPAAHAAILAGGSAEDFVTGLYPGKGKNYATQLQGVYLSGIRFRLKNMIDDYISVNEDDKKDGLAKLPGEVIQFLRDPVGAAERVVGDMDAQDKADAQADTAITELKEIAKRLKAGKDLEP